MEQEPIITEAAATPENVEKKLTPKQKAVLAFEAAKKLVEQRKTRLTQIEALERSRLEKVERKYESRRNAIIGAYITKSRSEIIASPEFQSCLIRDSDRAAFGLEPLPKASKE
ncbi:MAG: hypothetical protein K9K38_13350 [Rhodoferax sp.]|nr:hypothetical protein [Rhodoferax sp.]